MWVGRSSDLNPRRARQRSRTRVRRTTAAAATAAVVEGLESRLFLASAANASRKLTGSASTPGVPPPATGSINGQIFQDNNGNGTLDGLEPLISSPTVTVYLDLDNSGTFNAGDAQTTSSGGSYSFTGLVDGSYSVGLVAPPTNFVRTNTGFIAATVSGGGAATGKNFGNFPTVFNGSSGVDVYTVRIDPAASSKLQILETLSGGGQTTYSVTKSLVSTLTINGQASDDAFMVDYTNGNPIPGTSLNFDGGAQGSTTGDRVTITGTSGPDTISVYNADTSPGGGVIGVKNVEKVILNSLAGNDTLLLGAGIGCDSAIDAGTNTDSFTFTGTDNAEPYTIGASSIFDGSFTTTLAGVETLAINTRGGADTGIINGDATSPVTTIDFGDGDDNFTLNSANTAAMTVLGGNGNDALVVGQGVFAPITFDGGAGTADRITVNGSNGNDVMDVGASTVQRQGNTYGVSFSNTEQLTVDAAIGADIININGGSAALPITVLGSDGNDSLVVAAAAPASVNFDGGIGSNDATFNLTAGADNPVTIASGSVISSAKSLTLSNTQSLVINGLGGNDQFNFGGSAAATAVTVNGGDGNDTFNLNAALGNALIFNGGLTVTDQDTLNVNAASYTFNADANAGSANLALNVAVGAAVTFNATQHLGAVSVGGTTNCSANGNRVLCVKSLAVSGKLNLCDNDLIVDYSGGSPLGTWNGSAYTGLSGRIASGYDGGDWQGSGIVTNTGAAAAGQTTLGIAEASDALGTAPGVTALWDGQTVDNTCVLIKYTYNGDWNLDGIVNGDDYFSIDSGFPTQAKGYFNGDSNLDGVINGDDYFTIDSNFPSQGTPL